MKDEEIVKQIIKKELGGIAGYKKSVYGDEGSVYLISTPLAVYFLKISPNLEKERKRLEWAEDKLPVPKVISFTHIEDKDALLLSEIKGQNLKDLSKTWPAEKVIDKLVEALCRLHATDTKNCPFGEPGLNKVLIHGDACLPNFIFQEDSLSGYIDLGGMEIGNSEVDLSAAIWSLQYNLGPGYGSRFLEKYGYQDLSEETVEKLRLKYENYQREHGFL